jgi:hypothetical protein
MQFVWKNEHVIECYSGWHICLQMRVKWFIAQVICTGILSATVKHIQIAHGAMGMSEESEGVSGRKQRLECEEDDRTRLDSNSGQVLKSGIVRLFIVRCAM